MNHDDLMKSIDALVEEVFAEDSVSKADDQVGQLSRTTADAALVAVPKSENDSKNPGRPKQIASIPQSDDDGKRAGQYDADISEEDGEQEPEEAKKQAKVMDQTSDKNRIASAPKLTDARGPEFMKKSVSEEEYAEFEAFKKSKAESELKKAEDLKKAETESLIKSAVSAALGEARKETEQLRKAFNEQAALIKAIASKPQASKAITSIAALEKSSQDYDSGRNEYTQTEKLDAAERLIMRKAMPVDAIIELENLKTVRNPEWRALIEAELKRGNK